MGSLGSGAYKNLRRFCIKIFMKKILTSEEFRAEAEASMLSTKDAIVIFSGFIKSSAVYWLKEHVNDSVNVTLVGRFSASDLIKGASDLEVYSICKEWLESWNLK